MSTFSVKFILCLTFSYLLGCINPAYILGRLKGIDIRNHGSGNAGATNAMIVFSRPVGFAIGVLDALKAAVSWWVSAAVLRDFPIAGPACAVACSFGHMFPVTMGFRGGKGFACLLGTALAYDPKALFTLIFFAFFTALLSRYLCVATTSSAVAFPLYYWIRTAFMPGALVLALPAIPIFLKHIENFRRIRKKTEAHFSALWNKQKEMDRIAAIEE